ncbi:MAG: chemotaxis protein CheW [Cyanobacterium sp. T60_A2020_053]|nr:chemotaxis protein CheW [Cyanobacterium sp. T60_A2020_053]
MNLANLSSKPAESASQEKVKLLVFPIGNLNMALHIDVVQKIVNFSTVYSSGLNHYGMVNLEGEEITVLDLNQRLFHLPQTFENQEKKYLLLAQNSGGERFGIIIQNTPSLFDVTLNRIRALPASYRQADTLKIATHVTMIPLEEEKELTVFILDPDELINPNTN